MRELKRQIDSMLYERVGLSKDKDAVIALTNEGKITATPKILLRDPYILEFLNLLKLGKFKHLDAGQMNFYLNYLKDNEVYPHENPPVGIILCAEKDAEAVHYATAGMDDLFVSRYKLKLPSEEKLKQWLQEEQSLLEQINYH